MNPDESHSRKRRTFVPRWVPLCILGLVLVFLGGRFLVMHVVEATVQNAISGVPPALSAARRKARIPIVDGSEVVLGHEQVGLITDAFLFSLPAERRSVIVYEGYWTNPALVPDSADSQWVGLVHTDAATGRQIITLTKRTASAHRTAEIGVLNLTQPNLLVHVYQVAQ